MRSVRDEPPGSGLTGGVLVVNDFELGGGAERYRAALESGLRARGVRVDSLSFAPNDTEHPSLKTLTFGTVELRRLSNALDHDLEVVHLHNLYHRLSPLAFYRISALLASRSLRVVWTLHDGNVLAPDTLLTSTDAARRRVAAPIDYALPWRWDASRVRSCLKWYRWFAQGPGRRRLGSLAVTIVPSPMLFALLRSAGWPGPVVHLPNPDLSDRAETAPGGFGDRGDQSRSGFVYVGRVTEAKGLPFLLEHGDSRFLDELTVVGDSTPQAFGRCQALTTGRGLKTKFVGRKDPRTCERYIASASGVIIPTMGFENASLVLADAVALSTPVLLGQMNGQRHSFRASDDVISYDSLCPTSTAAATAAAFERARRGRVPVAESALGGGEGYIGLGEHLERMIGIYRAEGGSLAVV